MSRASDGGTLNREPLTAELGDSFDSLLRAAVDISDVPVPAPPPLPEGASLGAGRFRLCRLIGRGGMGAVYEAEDRDTGARVALKILSRVEPRAIRRFKDEFRSLADTIHPHLVRLRDLFMEDGLWFFTMDLVEGTTLSVHLARAGPVQSAEREHELRRLLPDLVDGVAAIHATGHLHRDLKPANVLVGTDGGVIIVDFGLVGELGSAAGAGGSLPIVGTASHMAPEQARGEPATTASDWYAVGTIVYEALTGRPPIEGDSAEVLFRKRHCEEPPLFLDEGPWPEDLMELCRGLLEPDPAKRPDQASIHRCLGRGEASQPRTVPEPSFVGRLRELAALDGALNRAGSGSLTVAWVSGPPGIGKTALVREFLRRAAQSATSARQAIVLSGRCYDREATPFKLLDGVVDSLSDALERHAPEARDALSPLAALFLGLTMEHANDSGTIQRVGLTEAETRSRAVQAFRKGLTALAKRGTVILHIEDVQWGDLDGVVLLDEVLEAPAPPALLILTERDGEESPALHALHEARFVQHAAVADVRLYGLAAPDVVTIVREIAGHGRSLDADAIARESEGSPYFAAEMTRHALEQGGAGAFSDVSTVLTLEGTILSRYRNLPAATRRVLEALSVCDGPTPLRLLEAATGVDDVERAVAVLRSASFVRTRRLRDAPGAEPYHDRVREEIRRALPEQRRRTLHLAFASALEALTPNAAEPMLYHYEGAGDYLRASLCARRSAERAAGAQAFEHAATLYRRALELGTWGPGESRTLYERLADALAMCGHNADAASAYERAAQGADGANHVRLQVLAASQLLCSGDVRSGIERLAESLERLGVAIPEQSEMMPRVLACIEQVFAETLSHAYVEEASIDADRLLRIDACWWAARGLSAIHHPASTFVTSVHLLEALRAGEPTRIARGAYKLAGLCSASQQEEAVPIVDALMCIGDAASARAPSATTRFFRDYSLAWQHHFAFDIDEVAAHVEAAYEHASAGGHGLETEMALLSILEMLARLARFENPKELGRSEVWRRDALRRGDRALATWMRTFDSQWWLSDTPEAFRAELNGLLSDVSSKNLDDQVLVWVVDGTLAWVERYLGLTADAFTRTTRILERSRGSPLWGVPKSRVVLGLEYVASAIAHAEAGGHTVPPDAEAVLSEFPVQASGLTDVLRAGIANVGGDRTEAIRLLERAQNHPGMERTRVVVAGARYSRGRLLGGARGETLVREELENLRQYGAANPERLLESWWPGFRSSSST